MMGADFTTRKIDTFCGNVIFQFGNLFRIVLVF